LNYKKILALVMLLGGIVMICISLYIKSEIEQGNLKISSAQSKVNQGNSLFSMSPYTKSMGQSMTGGAQKKINAGKAQIQYYTELAEQLQIGGIVLIVLSGGLFLISGKKKKK